MPETITPHIVVRDAARAADWYVDDAFWGERFGQIIDPFGLRWGLAQHLRDVSPDEVERAAAEAFGG